MDETLVNFPYISLSSKTSTRKKVCCQPRLHHEIDQVRRTVVLYLVLQNKVCGKYSVNHVFNGLAGISLFYNRLSSFSLGNLNVIMITPADIDIISICVEGFLFGKYGNISFYVLQIVPLLLVAKEVLSRCLFRNIRLISPMPIGQVLGSFSKRRFLYPLYSLRSQCC